MVFDRKNIRAARTPEEFVGREQEVRRLAEYAATKMPARGMIVMYRPGAGASELLKQTYDRLFIEGGETVPFYFQIRKSDRDVQSCCARLVHELLVQVVAFRRRDPSLLESPAIDRVLELVSPSDAAWAGPLMELLANGSMDGRELLKRSLVAPIHALDKGVRILTMIDDVHNCEYLVNGNDLIDELKESVGRGRSHQVLAMRRRFPFHASNCETVDLENLDFIEAGKLVRDLSSRLGVETNDQTCDLIAAQLDGMPILIDLFLEAARERRPVLLTFQQVQRLYADEVRGGRLAQRYDSLVGDAISNREIEQKFFEFFYDSMISPSRTPADVWHRLSGLAAEEFRTVMRRLDINEIVSAEVNSVEIVKDDPVLRDRVNVKFQMENGNSRSALVFSEFLSDLLKRAPKMMARIYRRNTSVGLRSLMESFDCQEVPIALLDYSLFKSEYKGEPADVIARRLDDSKEVIVLPQIIHASAASGFYSPISQIAEDEQCIVAVGFQDGEYSDGRETAWIGVEIDSKLEISKDLTEFWCDRLEMIAVNCNFRDFRLWLIAREGFAADALEVLRERNVLGSNRAQAEMLRRYVDPAAATDEGTAVNEYEMVVPMGEDTELIAAHAVEQIAKRHNFPAKAINQIKTALVEACINATEHSRSPDRKIYQKFTFEQDRIIITVANRGIRLVDAQKAEPQGAADRRGWGLSLIKGLMDEVKIEQTDEGTRISMTKFLAAA